MEPVLPLHQFQFSCGRETEVARQILNKDFTVFNPSEWNCLSSIYTAKISSCYFYSSNDFCSCWRFQKSMKMLGAEDTVRKTCFVKYISQNASSVFHCHGGKVCIISLGCFRNKRVFRMSVVWYLREITFVKSQLKNNDKHLKRHLLCDYFMSFSTKYVFIHTL